jgi:hypothetical protein
MAFSWTKALAAGAALFGGLLAGTTATRALVEVPAWERIGMAPWAELMRAENHGVGAVFYAVVGGIALLFTIATAIAARADRALRGSRQLSIAIYGAVVVAILAGIVTRAVLVPELYHLRDPATTTADLQAIFQRVSPWWSMNDLLHLVGFWFNLWALVGVVAAKARQG